MAVINSWCGATETHLGSMRPAAPGLALRNANPPVLGGGVMSATRIAAALSLCGILLLSACAPGYGTAASTESPAAPSPSADAVDGARMVTIEDGREVYLECAGEGSPTVLLVSGYRNNAQAWTDELDPSVPPVFGAIAEHTRVCAWDRPGTILDGDRRSRSDDITMPRTAQSVVDELDAVLQAAGEEGPYLVVAHSLGGLISRVFTDEHADEVIGLVLLDPLNESITGLLSEADLAIFLAAVDAVPEAVADYAALEYVDLPDALARAEGMTAAAAVPVVLIERSETLDFGDPAFDARLQTAWAQSQRDTVAQYDDARLVTAEGAGHYVQWDAADLVIAEILALLDTVR